MERGRRRGAEDAVHARAAWISPSGAASLLAIAAVLVVISLPRLRGLALQENEADAAATAQLLARALQRHESRATAVPALRELLRQPELCKLSDAELLVEGRVLRRHGYLFEVTRLSPVLTAPAVPAALLTGESAALGGLLAIRAWPWDHGTTGARTFLATEKGGRLVHANAPVVWEGLEAAGAELATLFGWRTASVPEP
jgi:hypothetical protein